jgi:hypothetical protein
VSLTEEQARDMEKQLVLRILGDACTEYAYAAEELERRKDFRSYVMRRAESSGFTLEEIAAATELTLADVEGLLRNGNGDGDGNGRGNGHGGGGGGGGGGGRRADAETRADAIDVTALFVGSEDADGGAHDAPGAADAVGPADIISAIGGDEDLLADDGETVLEVAPPFDVLRAVSSTEAVDALGFDDIAETIGHLNLQIGDDADEPGQAAGETSAAVMARNDALEAPGDREAEDQRIRSAWSWSRR